MGGLYSWTRHSNYRLGCTWAFLLSDKNQNEDASFFEKRCYEILSLFFGEMSIWNPNPNVLAKCADIIRQLESGSHLLAPISTELLVCAMENFPQHVLTLATPENVRGTLSGGWDAIDIAGYFGQLDWVKNFLKLAEIIPATMDLPHQALRNNQLEVVTWWLDLYSGHPEALQKYLNGKSILTCQLLTPPCLAGITAALLKRIPALRQVFLKAEIVMAAAGTAHFYEVGDLLGLTGKEISDALCYALNFSSCLHTFQRLVKADAFLNYSLPPDASSTAAHSVMAFIRACINNVDAFVAQRHGPLTILGKRNRSEPLEGFVFQWPLAPRLRALAKGHLWLRADEAKTVPRFFLWYAFEWIVTELLLQQLPEFLTVLVLRYTALGSLTGYQLIPLLTRKSICASTSCLCEDN